ncbi:MAG TPA: hypothetical protein VF596_04130 [Pyrinomonadaceae bacterium]
MKFDKRLFRLELKTKSPLSVLPLPELQYLLFLLKRTDDLNNLDALNETELAKLGSILQGVSPPTAAMKRLENRIDKADAFELDQIADKLEQVRERKPNSIRAEVEKEFIRRGAN